MTEEFQRCDSCKWGQEIPNIPDHYECRRFPPIMFPAEVRGTDYGTGWPYTHVDDWCGEYERGECDR